MPPEGAGFGQAEVALGAAIEADGARDILFEDCELSHTMTSAAWFRHGCREITMKHCHIHDLGAGGVKIGETSAPKDARGLTSHVTLDNCIIHGGGRYFPGAIGVWIGQNPDNTIRHCDIADFNYTLISIGWVWGYKPTPCARNVVENCHLHHYGWGVMSDMGAVYTLGLQPGTVIRGCHIHDAACASYGGWGLYNDEGSTGIVWEDNLVYRTQSGGYHQHYGRGNIVRNNIFAFNQEFQVRWSKPEEFLGVAFENNIVLFNEGRLFGHVDDNWFSGRAWVNRNVYWQVGGNPFDLAGKSWADWQLFGHDPESLIADPLFVAPEKGDWTLRAESPALRLGFKPFDWRKAGVTGDDAWRKLAAVEYPPVVFSAKPKPRPLRLHDDFETTPLDAKPGHGARLSNQLGPVLAVVNGGSKGERALELRDGPDVSPQFEPHFYYVPHHDAGTTRVSFDVRLESGYQLNYEWRDDAQPYRTGPQLIFESGAAKANGRKLIDLPSEGWLHVEVEARLGEPGDATWSCTLTAPGQQPQRFDALKFVDPAMAKLDWLGWSSNGKAKARAWIDEIEIENRR
ncbi:MAG: right-handed parallel beta-helix repeat-containing protein [Chthoniobacteraceae bacterium]